MAGRSITFENPSTDGGYISPDESVTISEGWGLGIDALVAGVGIGISYDKSNDSILNAHIFGAGLGLDISYNLNTKEFQTAQIGGMTGLGFRFLGITVTVHLI
jgi:hypothetical protein